MGALLGASFQPGWCGSQDPRIFHTRLNGAADCKQDDSPAREACLQKRLGRSLALLPGRSENGTAPRERRLTGVYEISRVINSNGANAPEDQPKNSR
ncbi:hypothetical protein SBV1_2850012 [Verrucomicrobia bacterium]|nr:hypothetical protein SBV1_2850012 [Verrucomicrobiota bacterium]